MARKERNGKRRSRDQRMVRRIPEMGYYLVVTDTEATERLYFNGFHESLPENVKKKLVIKVIETKTQKLVERCQEMVAYDPQYRIPWIVFDRDEVSNFDEIIRKAEREDINVGWSNPCFEIWLFGYYNNLPSIQNSWTCCEKFGDLYEKKTGQSYEKADSDVYRRICTSGNEEDAIKRAADKHRQMIRNGMNIPSEMCPCTTVYKLIDEIKGKIKES